MGRVLLMGIAFVVVLYALIDVVQSRGDDVRSLPKGLWALLVVVVPVLGAVGWFVWGRPLAADGRSGPGRRRGPLPPDDDPAFLRQIDDVTWSQKMRARREKRDDDGPTTPNPPPR